MNNNANSFSVVVLGGFGVAKNLCSWAVQGKDCSVNEQVKAVLQAFHGERKPIGLCCISPVLAAKVFPGCEVTVGNDKDERYRIMTLFCLMLDKLWHHCYIILGGKMNANVDASWSYLCSFIYKVNCRII